MSAFKRMVNSLTYFLMGKHGVDRLIRSYGIGILTLIGGAYGK